MKKEIPKCKHCNQPMLEIGGIGKQVQWEDFEAHTMGQYEMKLYQCPECKEVKIQ